MSEYVFRYANGYGCDMGALMDGGRQTVGDYFASDNTDHYGTLHEEIVRCRDCKHYITKFRNEYDDTVWCGLHAGYVEPDGFCSWAVRRDA